MCTREVVGHGESFMNVHRASVTRTVNVHFSPDGAASLSRQPSPWLAPHLPGTGTRAGRARGVGVWAPAPSAPLLGRVPPEPPSRPRPSPTGAAPALAPSLGPQPGPPRSLGPRKAALPVWGVLCVLLRMGLGGRGANGETEEELNLRIKKGRCRHILRVWNKTRKNQLELQVGPSGEPRSRLRTTVGSVMTLCLRKSGHEPPR